MVQKKKLVISLTKDKNNTYLLPLFLTVSSCYKLFNIRFSVAKTQPLAAAKLRLSLQRQVHNFFAMLRHLSAAFTALIFNLRKQFCQSNFTSE